MLKNVIESHVEDFSQLHNRQYGFRKFRSCEHCLNALLQHLDSDQIDVLTALLSFDIKGAFDHARWRDISNILAQRGFPNYIIRVLRSYFTDRFVSFNGFRRRITLGCPQGSVLGPLLWDLVFDDIMRQIVEAWVDLFCYADDTLARYHCHEVSPIISHFLMTRLLRLNTSKTECIIVYRRSWAQKRPVPSAISRHYG